MDEIRCECSDEVLQIKDLHIEDNSFSDGFGTVTDVDVVCPNCGANSFSDGFGTVTDVDVVCPNCGAPMAEFANIDDVIEAKSEW